MRNLLRRIMRACQPTPYRTGLFSVDTKCSWTMARDARVWIGVSAGACRPGVVVRVGIEDFFHRRAQIQLKHEAVFPVAEVAIRVAQTHPPLLPLLLARLHQAPPPPPPPK